MMTWKKLRPGLATLHVNTEENSGKLQRLCIQVSNIFGTRNLPWLVCNCSSNSFFRSSAKAAGWIYFIAAAFLHNSNSYASFFPLPPSLSLAECLSPTNNFSLSHTEFREIFLTFSPPQHFILYTNENDFALSLVLAL